MCMKYIVVFSALLALGCSHQARDSTQGTFQIKPTTNHELVSASSAADYDQIGLHYEQANNPEMAMVAYQKALRLEPDRVSSLKNLSALCVRQQRVDQAIPLLEQLVIAEPNARNYNNLGFAYLQKQAYVEAEDAFNRAIALDGEYLKAKNNLALLQMSVVAAQSSAPNAAAAVIQPSQASLRMKDKYLYGLEYQTNPSEDRVNEVAVVDGQPASKPSGSGLAGVLKFLSLLLLL